MENLEKISFIIPALNEEKNLPGTINSIKSSIPHDIYEIIVCDNGSEDNTASIAKNLGALVIVDPKSTIGGLRNGGANISSGNTLVFIDSDIRLANNWYEMFCEKILDISETANFITGSSCLPPENPGFFEKYWFSKFKNSKGNYINSGHLIIPRKTFNKLGGFDNSLKTSEDYDICQRANRNGIPVFKTEELKAYHDGFPKSLFHFLEREAWHGREDLRSFKNLKKSKTALASITNSVLLISGPILHFFTNLGGSILLTTSLSLILCMTLSYMKFGSSIKRSAIATTICCELYLIGRTGSIFTSGKRPRARS